MRFSRRALALVAAAGIGALPGAAAAPAKKAGAAAAGAPRPAAKAPDAARTVAAVDAAVRADWTARGLRPGPAATDLEILRRLTLDLAGRIPTLAEIEAFQAAAPPLAAKRAAAAARLAASADFAEHRAWTLVDHYGANAVSARGVDEDALHDFVAGALRAGRGYDAVVRDLIGAEGSTHTDGAANFLAMADGNPTAMAVEVADRLLGLSMGCAQCHDHVDGTWKKEEFWAFTSFFARASYVPDIRDGKGPPDWHLIELPYGEVRMGMALPGSGPIFPPRYPDGTAGPAAPDARRRDALAAWVTAPANPWFAKERVKQVAALMLGAPLPAAAVDALAAYYVDSGFAEPALARAVAATEAYALSSRPGAGLATAPVRPLTLRVIVRSIALATGAPVDGGAGAAAGAGARYGKGARKKAAATVTKAAAGDDAPDLMGALDAMARAGGRRAGGTGIDPASTDPSLVRALFLMNGRLVDAATMPFPGSALSALLDSGRDAASAIDPVVLSVLGRPPTAAERTALVAHVEHAPSPRAGWSDVLWALFNASGFLYVL